MPPISKHRSTHTNALRNSALDWVSSKAVLHLYFHTLSKFQMPLKPHLKQHFAQKKKKKKSDYFMKLSLNLIGVLLQCSEIAMVCRQ